MVEKKTKLEYLRKVPLLGEWFTNALQDSPTVGVLRLNGVIGPSGLGTREALSLVDQDPFIERVFKLPRLKAVAIIVNSPGGSPVQAALLATRIRGLSKEKSIPVYAFCEDVAASGGYWLACAADEIYADPASILSLIHI